MDFGQNMMLLRKQKKYSQAALGKMIGTSGDVIGRYERDDIKPSVDVVAKIADALEESIDYLVGKTSLRLDRKLLQRLEDIEALNDEGRSFVLRVLDMALRGIKTQKAYA